MTDLDFEQKFRHIITKIAEVGELYAEAKGQSWQLQELKGTVLSKIIREQGEIPTSKAEIIAKASPDYEKYIQETGEAIKKELRFKAEYEMWKASFEALRSLSSLEKSTRNQIGG